MYELSSEKMVLLDTEVFKGPRFTKRKILDVQTHYKLKETCQYTWSLPFNVKKSYGKGYALHLLRTNSVKESYD